MGDSFVPNFEVSEELGRMLAEYPNSFGQLTVWREGDDWHYAAMVVPDVDDEMFETLKEWGKRSLLQLVESGDPEANGWFPSSDPNRPGAWYMTAVLRELPPI